MTQVNAHSARELNRIACSCATDLRKINYSSAESCHDQHQGNLDETSKHSIQFLFLRRLLDPVSICLTRWFAHQCDVSYPRAGNRGGGQK